jgi:hypothetical protein
VRSKPLSPSIRTNVLSTIMIATLLTSAACWIFRPAVAKANIIQGEQYVHRIQLPGRFVRSVQDPGKKPFDRYAFRLSPSSPDVLLIAGCRYESVTTPGGLESYVCSSNAYAIDTAHSYTARVAANSEWDQAALIDGYLEMSEPSRRTLKQELAKPPFLRALPLGPETRTNGYRYRGQDYRPQADWITAPHLGAAIGKTSDGKLVVLAGYDVARYGSEGTYALEFFDGAPSRRVAALDVAYPSHLETWLRRVSLVNSRWVVVGLDSYLQSILLLDFRSLQGDGAK